jgi:hypothetical protein
MALRTDLPKPAAQLPMYAETYSKCKSFHFAELKRKKPDAILLRLLNLTKKIEILFSRDLRDDSGLFEDSFFTGRVSRIGRENKFRLSRKI